MSDDVLKWVVSEKLSIYFVWTNVTNNFNNTWIHLCTSHYGTNQVNQFSYHTINALKILLILILFPSSIIFLEPIYHSTKITVDCSVSV